MNFKDKEERFANCKNKLKFFFLCNTKKEIVFLCNTKEENQTNFRSTYNVSGEKEQQQHKNDGEF